MQNALKPARGNRLASIPLPDGIVAFGIPDSLRHCLIDAFIDAVTIYTSSSDTACCNQLGLLRSPALVIVIPSSTDTETFRQIAEMRARFPLASMCGFFIDNTSDLGVLAKLGGMGLTGVVQEKFAHRATHLRAMLSHAHVESFAARIMRLANLSVAPHAESVLRHALRLAHEPLSLPRLAESMRMHERTLRKYCYAHALPSPQWIIGWSRSLAIAYYLQEDGRSIQSIASLLGFSTSGLLANHLKRYTGTTASVLRQGNPLHEVARLAQAALSPPLGSPHARSGESQQHWESQ